jgi:hypothetical protein
MTESDQKNVTAYKSRINTMVNLAAILVCAYIPSYLE